MTNFKLLTTLSIAAIVASSAIAQDEAEIVEPTLNMASDDFTSADLDQDGALNADEFITFAVMRAEGGNETFKDIVLSGEYNTKFLAYDADASGGLSIEELGLHEDETAADVDAEPESEAEEISTDEPVDTPE